MYFIYILLLMMFVSCSTEVASTDVDNEITISMTGSVSTGTSMARTTVYLQDSTEVVIDSTQTDSLGQFNFKINNSQQKQALLLYAPQAGYRAYVSATQNKKYIAVHAISDWTYQTWKKNKKVLFDPFADEELKKIFGDGVNKEGFLFDSTFIPFRGDGDVKDTLNHQGPGPFGPPSPQAVILRQLSLLALLSDKTVPEYLDSMLLNEQPLLKRLSFVAGMMVQGARMGQDSSRFQSQVGGWIAPNGIQPKDPPLADLSRGGFEIQKIPSIVTLPFRARPFAIEALNMASYAFLEEWEKSIPLGDTNAKLPKEWQVIIPGLDSTAVSLAVLIDQKLIGMDQNVGFRIVLEVGQLMGRSIAQIKPESREFVDAHLLAQFVRSWVGQVVLKDFDPSLYIQSRDKKYLAPIHLTNDQIRKGLNDWRIQQNQMQIMIVGY